MNIENEGVKYMEKKKVKEEYKVTQSNFIVEATHKTPFTLHEMRLLLTMVSLIENKETQFRPLSFSVVDFCEALGIKTPKYTTVKTAIRDLMSKTVEFKDPKAKKVDVFVNWFHKITYNSGEGRVTFIFHEELTPYLIDLKRDFTTYKLGYVLVLKSMYAIRLYELGKKWSGTKTGNFDYSLEELKLKLGASKDSYKIYGTFKQKVLQPSLDEINEKTDMKMEFEEIKEGRKVVGVSFTAKLKEPEKKPQKELPNPNPTPSSQKKKPVAPKYGRSKKVIREEPLPEWWDKYEAENEEKEARWAAEKAAKAVKIQNEQETMDDFMNDMADE